MRKLLSGNPKKLPEKLKRALLDKQMKRRDEEIEKVMEKLRNVFCGDDKENEEVTNSVVTEVIQTKLIATILTNFDSLSHEARNNFVDWSSCMLRLNNNTNVIDYFFQDDRILTTLIKGNSNENTAHHFNAILLSCVYSPRLCRWIASSELFYNFFDYICMPEFSVASNSFKIFKKILKTLDPMDKYIMPQFKKFFKHFHRALLTGSIFIKRQLLHLLAEMLLSPTNVEIRSHYLSKLKYLNNLTSILKGRDDNKTKTAAFHVLKVFVVSEKKEIIKEALADKLLVDAIAKIEPNVNDKALKNDKNKVINELEKIIKTNNQQNEQQPQQDVQPTQQSEQGTQPNPNETQSEQNQKEQNNNVKEKKRKFQIN